MTITHVSPKDKRLENAADRKRKRQDYRTWRDAVSDELQNRSHFDAAERWDYCDESPRTVLSHNQATLPPSVERVYLCSASHEHDAVLLASSCDLRICPDCAQRHSARLLSRYLPEIEKQMGLHPEYRLRTITLTRSVQLGCKDFGEIASDGFTLIQKLMRKVVGPDWNKKGAGLLANWEVGPNGQKLHYHMIYLGNWVDQKQLSRVWGNLTGGDIVVWVSAVKHNDGDWQGAVIETLKYATKFYSENKVTKVRNYLSPELTVDLFEALANTRRIRSYGSFYSIDEPLERTFVCSACGSKLAPVTIGHYELWRLTGFTLEGWRRAIKDAFLQFRTADNYTPHTGKTDKSHPKSTRLLPGFDQVPTKKRTHYDYE